MILRLEIWRNFRLDDWRFLVSILNKYSSKLLRLGERQARAVDCLADLRNSTMFWSPFSAWLRDWSIDELQRSRDGLDGCYQISTISTYLSAVGSANDTIDIDEDPLEWEEAEWSRWVLEVNRKSTPAADELGDAEGKSLNERAKHALHALVTSLIRRHQFVPLEIRSQLGLQTKKTVCRNSASSTLILSTLILKADLAQSIEILKEWHKESPADFLLADFRATISTMVPCRTGDISSLKTVCLTPGGGLVFERAGYDVHKTRSAIRLIPLSPENASELEQKMQVLDEHFGDRLLLLRSDGSHAAGLRDQRLANDFGLALKQATNDEKARPHSVRAATLQEAAWPGWQEQAYKLLQSREGSQSCVDWINMAAECPLRLSRAVAMAGQSDLRSALGNYLAAWPIINGIYCKAALVNLSAEPAFLTQLGLSPANLRKARSRNLAKTKELFNQTTAFDTQTWIEQQATKHNMPRILAANTSTVKPIQKQAPPPASISRPQISRIEQLTYMSVRALGLSRPKALERVVIPHSVASQLDMYLPSEELIAVAKRRLRKGPESRGQAADIEMAMSSIGREALIWLCELDHDVFKAFKSRVFRTESANRLMFNEVNLVKALETFLPKCLSISIKFGAKHLDGSEKSAFTLMAPAITFNTNSRLGQRPEISISLREKQNFVISARLTSVVRIYTLALEEFRKYLEEAEHAE